MQCSKVKVQFGDVISPSVLDREYLLFKKFYSLSPAKVFIFVYPKLFRYFMTGKL